MERGWGYLFAVQLKFPEQVASLLSVKCQRIVVQILYFRYSLQIQTINLEQSLKWNSKGKCNKNCFLSYVKRAVHMTM